MPRASMARMLTTKKTRLKKKNREKKWARKLKKSEAARKNCAQAVKD
jgi:hypothetical protein